MNRIFYALLVLAAFTSCANSYNIKGTSDVQVFDGRMLYLKVYNNNDLKNVDSCDIVHGRFHFAGTVDSARLATLFMGEDGIMPLVIESGEITVKIDNRRTTVSGTPLNDRLTEFLDSMGHLQDQVADLSHQHSQAIMNGEDEAETAQRLNKEYAVINENSDRFVTSFIEENFDNALGPGIFFIMTASSPYPELQPWIEALMSKATDNFKNDAYVKDYMEKARQNEAIMNGMADQPSAAPQPPAGQHLPSVPTPNQMAMPADSASAVAQ
ncbi:MAG: DUF4369 domain-containing protein [Prevotella sp.]|nr:DUF4369 domain-containing protein [Prevotella sp.]